MPHGKICYLEIPATDAKASAVFYSKVFGWKTRTRGDGHLAFDDESGYVSGSWVLGRTPMREPGVLTYVWVDSIDEALKTIASSGGRMVKERTPIGGDSSFATFLDPVGNLIGLYEERKA